ncbi:hypothetical protein [Alteromonas halophila]|uniref:Phosphate/phosphite/phosphonate ABC transporter substrate-binding protein n=1 Tax=Alteromonas halophila TaxID=516698 RepID=A0A918JNE5_9ALTE|nr:hypothetical protein [Alteromonas halophila]GGW92184.1 hypothetical protein GCM10007391_28110 [Alteromonas halophila]
MSLSVFLHKTWGLLLLVAAIACGVISYWQNAVTVPAIKPQTGLRLQCPTTISTNSESYDVYVTDASIAEMAIEKFCNNPVVKRQFGNVNVVVGQNDYDTFRYINHGVVDLALVKSNVVEAFGADDIYGFKNIASHPDYSAYFIALREKPELTKEFLLGKRIGILDYPSSRSGHIVPKTVLKSLGLTENNVELNYYNSHQELRSALLAGDVDIISSYWGSNDDAILSRNYATALIDNVSGMQWFLKLQTRNTDLLCATQQVIQSISDMHPRSYYQNVTMMVECENVTL